MIDVGKNNKGLSSPKKKKKKQGRPNASLKTGQQKGSETLALKRQKENRS